MGGGTLNRRDKEPRTNRGRKRPRLVRCPWPMFRNPHCVGCRIRPHKDGGRTARRRGRAQATTGRRRRGRPRTAEHAPPHKPRGTRPRRAQPACAGDGGCGISAFLLPKPFTIVPPPIDVLCYIATTKSFPQPNRTTQSPFTAVGIAAGRLCPPCPFP